MTTPISVNRLTAEIYECHHNMLDSGIIPTTLLPHSHPFRPFLLSHLRSLATTGKFDGVIDAFISIYSGDALWRPKSSTQNIVTQRQKIRTLLQQPPDFVLVDQDASQGFGFHSRTPGMANFICITREYVNLWNEAPSDSYVRLALEAVLKATTNHELAHWIITQVSNFQGLTRQDTTDSSVTESWAISTDLCRCDIPPLTPTPNRTGKAISYSHPGEYEEAYPKGPKSQLESWCRVGRRFCGGPESGWYHRL